MIYKTKTKQEEVEYIIWDGENKEEVETFLDGNGYVKGAYVDIGTSFGLRAASIGNAIVKYKHNFYITEYKIKKEDDEERC